MNRQSFRKTILIVHIATSVGLLGAIAVFFALAVTGMTASDNAVVNASYAVMPRVTWLLIVPLTAAALGIGILQSFLSPWGLMRHYWVLVKLTMTVVIAAVLMLQTGTIDRLGLLAQAANLDGSALQARYSVLLHSGAGLSVLLVVLILSVLKPRGATGWGLRATG